MFILMEDNASHSTCMPLFGYNSVFGLPHYCKSQNVLEISNFVLPLHSLGSFGSLGQISLSFDRRPPECFYLGYLNLSLYVLLITQSIGTKSAKWIGWWFYMVPEMYIMDPENLPVM